VAHWVSGDLASVPDAIVIMIKSLLMKTFYDRFQLQFITLLVLLPTLTLSCQPLQHTFHGSPYVEPKPAPGFQLTQTNGEILSFPSDISTPALLFFGYTYCPDVCPATAAHVRWVFDQLGNDSNKVTFIFITVDPERDSLNVIDNFLSRFNPNFLGLRGELVDLDPIKLAYGVFAEKDPESPEDRYFITHTARVFLIDENGILCTSYPFNTQREDILADLRYLVGNSP